MFRKNLLLVVLLMAAIFGPAIYFNASWPELTSVDNSSFMSANTSLVPTRNPGTIDLSPQTLNQQVTTIKVAPVNGQNVLNPARTATQSPSATPFVGNVILPGTSQGPDFNAVPLEFMPVTNLNEIFRFDINAAWVRQRWDRVSTTAGGQGLQGLRVALVTGVNTQDLFGSLTYFFDANQVPQKITFRGWTGDPNSLIQFVTQGFGFKKQPTSAAGLYIAKSWQKSTGVLFLQNASVARANHPTQQVAVLLEFNNPNGPYLLTTEVASLVFQTKR